MADQVPPDSYDRLRPELMEFIGTPDDAVALADRVNMAEGVLEDLARGQVPNLIEEMGLAAEWRYDRQASIRRIAATVAVAGAVAGVGYVLLRSVRREGQAAAA